MILGAWREDRESHYRCHVAREEAGEKIERVTKDVM